MLRYQRTPLILRTIRIAQHAVGGPLIVVLGNDQQRLRSLLRRHADNPTVVYNSDWRTGLASSLRAGIKRVSPTASAVLILLVDQARLGRSDLSQLVRRWQKRPSIPAAAYYAGRPGAPAVIPRKHFKAVGMLDGDVGARRLLRGLGELTLVAMPAAAFDVDTPADAAALIA